MENFHLSFKIMGSCKNNWQLLLLGNSCCRYIFQTLSFIQNESQAEKFHTRKKRLVTIKKVETTGYFEQWRRLVNSPQHSTNNPYHCLSLDIDELVMSSIFFCCCSLMLFLFVVVIRLSLAPVDGKLPKAKHTKLRTSARV